jgi:hypothetical protein
MNDTETLSFQLRYGTIHYVKVIRSNESAVVKPVGVVLTHTGGAQTEFLYLCASATGIGSIAGPTWICQYGKIGGNEFDIEHSDDLYFAIFMASSNLLELNLSLGFVTNMTTLEHAAIVGLLVLVLSILSILVIALVECWRSHKKRPLGIPVADLDTR